MTADPEPQRGATPLRADARRNRQQIIAAAKAIFAAEGPDAPMDEIARQAGVGVGTLYRRFPDRNALIRAVARDNFAEVLAHAREAVANEPTAWDALVRLLARSRELELSMRLAMVSPTARATIRDDPETHDFREQLLGMLDQVVHAAQAEGSLRTDIDTGDVAILFSLLFRTVHAKSGLAVPTERALGIMLDGLRASTGTPLPGRPLAVGDFIGATPE